jgi:cobalt-zinc-cadmium efflux system outer membrane protein
MNRRPRAIVTVLVGLIAAAIRTTAQQPLTLVAAQAEARAHAPDPAELQARVSEAEAIAAQASRLFRQNPTVSTSYASGSLIGLPEERAWTVGISQLFDVSGSRHPRSASAASDVERARFDRDDGLRALDERVAVAVANVALQQRLVAREERIVALQTIAADAAHRQLDVGQGTELDADSADLDLAGARMTLEQARADMGRARIQLARLIVRESAADLVVDDPPEALADVMPPDFEAIVNRDPRLRAASAELDAARFERQMVDRLVKPSPTLSVEYGNQRRDIPAGSFTGAPFAGALTTVWPDHELRFNVSVPLPFFDRLQESRARSTGRILAAEARLRVAEADVRSELGATWLSLQSAGRAAQAVATTPDLIERDAGFVEQAVRAGAFDTVTRSLTLRRLQDAGRHLDTAIRDYRAARAAWLRRTDRLQP